MTTEIEKYQKAKRELSFAQAWASLIGVPYQGGGGGIGEVVRLTVQAEVYHQPYNGANNYHDIPPRLAEYISSAVKVNFGKLLADSLAAMDMEVKKLAEIAVKEHAELMDAAGITKAA